MDAPKDFYRNLLTRRKTLQLMAGTTVFGALSGCGGSGAFGGSSSGGAQGTKSVTVPYKLPANFAVPPSQLAGETLFDTQSLGSGSFRSTMLSDSRPVAAFLRDTKTDKYVLGGIAGAGTAGVSALGSAVLLLAMTLGVFNLPVIPANDFIVQLENNAAVKTLASVIETRLKANAFALFSGDAAIDAAVATAYAALKPNTARQVVKPAAATRQAGSTNLILVQPGDQSMARVVQADEQGSITIYNLARRPMSVYVYRIADTDANGVRTDLTVPERITGPTEIEATSSILGATVHLGVAYAPVKGPTIPLPVHPGKSTTFYEVIVLMASAAQGAPEPAFFLEQRYKSYVDGWRKELGELNVEAGVGGLFLGFVQAVIGGSFSQFAPRAAAAAIAANLASLEAGLVATAVQQLKNSLYRDGIQKCLLACAGAERSALRLFIEKWPGRISGGVEITLIRAEAIKQAAVLKAAATIAARAIGAVTTILSVADFGFAAADLVASSRGEKWSATSITPKVSLTPATVKLLPGATAPFTASISADQPGQKFTYIWTLTGGTSSILSDRSVTPPKTGREIETDSPVITLVTSPSEVDTTVLTVQVEALLVEGQPGHPTFTSIGKATGKATIDASHVESKCAVNVTGIESSIANLALPISFEVPRVGAWSYSNNPAASHLGVNFSNSVVNEIGISITATTEFAAGQQYSVGGTAGVRVEYLSKGNGVNNIPVFLGDSGTLTITRFDGKVLGFSASGHMNLVGENGGAKFTITGAVQVG